MPIQSVKKIVQHSPKLMFDLVSDIKEYPKFVPGCKKIIISESTYENDNNVIISKMTVGVGLILENFTSKITLDSDNCTIVVNNYDGLFKKLNNVWIFEKDKNGCMVHFTIDFELIQTPISPLIALMFSKVFDKYINAFERRANELYC
jgi:coenzyme Q-binding protein COQ10